jgi:hypothetical protein
MSLVMRDTLCDYCSKQFTESLCTSYHLHGIRCCEQHIPLGHRDIKAWLRMEKIVRMNDFLEVHPTLDEMKLNVPRTDGTITEGGNISKESFQFLQEIGGEWRLKVLFTCPKDGQIKNKWIPLVDLEKSGILAEELATWRTTLDGFYKEELEAHVAAMAVGIAKVERELPFIVPMFPHISFLH